MTSSSFTPSRLPPFRSPSPPTAARVLRARAASRIGSLALLGAAALGCGQGDADRASATLPAPASGEHFAEAASALTAAPVCLVLRRGSDGNALDSMISGGASTVNTNYGAQSAVYSTGNATAPTQTLVQWDLSSVPAAAAVLSATITFNLSPNGAGTLRAHLITAPWSEGTVTWNTFAGAFAPASVASFANGYPTSAPVVTFDVLPTVQQWVSGSVTNRGLLFEQSETSVTFIRSSEGATLTQRPRLDLCYQLTCDAGTADCDGNGENGCEASITTTVSCGACGHVCSFPHAAASCTAGACALGACDVGFADCDGNASNGCETAITTPGSCGGCGVVCDDGNACTTESCVAGACASTPVVDGTSCNDGNACTQGDSCQAGACASGAPVVCAALDACHDAGTCDVSGGCSNPPKAAGASCSDGNPCNGSETCDGSGACVAGAPIATDDGNPCTVDSCDLGGPTHLPSAAGTSCSDGNACNGAETCNGAGACQLGAAPIVDDGNPCTTDACFPATGVSHTVNVGASCSDGDACNGAETCAATGVCQVGAAPAVDDGNACTTDACDPAIGVTHVAVADGTACSDGNASTIGDTCQAGACVSGYLQICAPNSVAACYSGSAGTQNVGPCHAGQKTCNEQGSAYGPCVGEVTPQPEDCATPVDEDCDGQTPLCPGAALWSMMNGGAEDDRANAITLDPSGNSIVAGYASGTIDFGCGPIAVGDIEGDILIKRAPDGTCLWNKTFSINNPANHSVNGSVGTDSSGNIYVGGFFTGSINAGGATLKSTEPSVYDAYVVKLTSAGAHVWSKKYGSTGIQTIRKVLPDGAGNVYLVGSFFNTINFGGGTLTSVGSADIYVAKLNASGTQLWAKRFGDASAQLGLDAAVDATGIVIIGSTFGTVDFGGGPLVTAGGSDVVLAKLSPTGAHVWSKRFGDGATQTGIGVTIDPSGNVIMVGSFYGSINLGGQTFTSVDLDDAFIAKLNPSGAHLWSSAAGGLGSQQLVAVAADASGNLITTGNVASTTDFGGGPRVSAGAEDLVIVKYSPAGAHLWSKISGNVSSDLGRSVAINPLGQAYVCGSGIGANDLGNGPIVGGGGEDMIVVKLAP